MRSDARLPNSIPQILLYLPLQLCCQHVAGRPRPSTGCASRSQVRRHVARELLFRGCDYTPFLRLYPYFLAGDQVHLASQIQRSYGAVPVKSIRDINLSSPYDGGYAPLAKPASGNGKQNVLLLTSPVYMHILTLHLSCESVLRTTQVLTIVLQLVIAGFTSLRMYAIWQKDRKILALVLFLGLVPAGVNMYYYTTLTIVSSPSPFTGCGEYVKLSMNVTDILGIFNCVFAIFSDSVVLVLTWLKTYKIRRTFSKLHMKGGLVELLQRDGTIYFLALLILNVINVVAIRASQAFGSIPALTEVLTSILISRFILNLRGVHISSSGTGSQLSSTAHLSRFSGVYFASNMAGNLGAPLGNSLTGADEGTELTSEDEEEPALISDDPLMTGLLAEPDDKGSVVELKLTDIYDSHV
ncbi:hypothetical protein AcW1_009762 [Taiwanofungus camphoratus]|nr:hypothetical protein AcV7_002443 [Antrodia cinnamomea]KAI0948178.1 hypothetical protein AcW1_009762 [Antrodia cinnamomea]